MTLYKHFRGWIPSIQPLLERRGAEEVSINLRENGYLRAEGSPPGGPSARGRRIVIMQKTRRVLDAVFLLLILFNLFSWFILPDNTAVHYGRGGIPDSWASKGVHILWFTGMMALIYAGFIYSPKILDIFPVRIINLPNREYWLTDENRPEAKDKLARLMYSFGAATGLLLLISSIASVAANLSDPVRLNDGLFIFLAGLYLVYMVWWIVKLFIEFKVPE